MRKTVTAIAMTALLVGVIVPAAYAIEQPVVLEVMVFSETAGFRHSSIPNGMAMIDDIAANETFTSVDFNVTHVTSSMVADLPDAVFCCGYPHNLPATVGSVFTDEGLAPFDIVVFISTTGSVLDTDEQAAFERWVQDGGGYVGMHAAADAEYEWPWYGDFVGAQFDSHPAIQEATLAIEDGTHIATSHLDAEWIHTDEWYNYRQNPREFVCHTRPEAEVAGVGVETESVGVYAAIFWYPGKDVQNTLQADAPKECGVNVLMTLDETSYNGGNMGDDHPITWCNEWDGGRAFYTGLGHTEATYSEPNFITMITGGLLTVSGVDGLDEHPDFEDLGVSFDCESVAE